MISQNYKIDLVPNGIMTVVHVSQYDVGSRTIVFNLLKDGLPYVPDSGVTAYIEGQKPNGSTFSVPATLSDSTVSINLTGEMTEISGDVICKIALVYANQNRVGSSSFVMAVDSTPHTND